MWRTVLEQTVDFEQEFFMQTMELLFNEPNIIANPILRAEIVSDSTVNNSRVIHRKLLPRQPHKDPVVLQSISVSIGSTITIEYSSDTCPLPYYYPNCSFRYVYYNFTVSIMTLDSKDTINSDSKDTINSQDHQRMNKNWARVLKFIVKISRGFKNGYKKRVHHDLAVPKNKYQDLYMILKTKYKSLVTDWEENTDPSKFVFEDIAIATWLILLWNTKSEKKYQFVDVGCGNGLLTFILNQEGYSGYGIDLSRRKIWDKFPNSTLIECAIQPNTHKFENVEWIIGNHPDELTMWIPIFAHKAHAKFVIIPCCFHVLGGQKFTALNPSLGRYMTYIEHVENHCHDLGFETGREYLRIPSTKNICIWSKNVSFTAVEYPNTVVEIRKTDRQKTLERQQKLLAKQTIASQS
jgi:hypothetical protein